MKSEWSKVTLLSVCSRLSSGKSISSKLLKEKGVVPVYGGNGVRGYIEEGENFNGECAIIGRQGAYCGNVRFFSGKAYMTEHAIVVQSNECADTRFLAYKLSLMQLGRLSGQSAQPGLSVKVLGEQVIDIPHSPFREKSPRFSPPWMIKSRSITPSAGIWKNRLELCMSCGSLKEKMSVNGYHWKL